MSITHELGDYVLNPNKPDWGPGKVLGISGTKITIFFRDVSERPVRKIETSIVGLVPALISSDPILDNLPPYDPEDNKLGKKRVTHADGIEFFRSHYPLLFDDPGYLGDRKKGERDYKVEAHDAFQDQLSVWHLTCSTAPDSIGIPIPDC